MTKVHANLENKEIMEKPDNIIEVDVCMKSGKLPTPGLCDAHIYKEYFEEGTEPTEPCNLHVLGLICGSDNVLATEYCPYKTEGATELPFVEDPLLYEGSKLGSLLYSLGEIPENADIDALLAEYNYSGFGTPTCHHTFEYMLENHWEGDPANGGYGYPEGWFPPVEPDDWEDEEEE